MTEENKYQIIVTIILNLLAYIGHNKMHNNLSYYFSEYSIPLMILNDAIF